MKTSPARLALVAACAASWLHGAPFSLLAQTSTTSTAHKPASSATAAHKPVARTTSVCAAVPPLSPKIPALPVGTGCAKPLYTITSSASQLSPMLSAPLKESLQKLDQSFTESYLDLKVGTGALAQPKMYYTVNYTGYLVDGTKFDSSEGKEPITFPYGAHRVIQGWDTGFEGMHVGGKRRLFVPYQLAYGEAGRPPVIPAKAELVFDVELISQSDQPPAPKTPPTPPAGAPGTPGSPTTPGAPGTTGAPGAPGTAPAGSPGAAPSTAPGTVPGAPNQPANKPATPPVNPTTPAKPPSPTGSTTPKP